VKLSTVLSRLAFGWATLLRWPQAHAKELPYVCHIAGCGKRLTSQMNLDKHIAVHNGAGAAPAMVGATPPVMVAKVPEVNVVGAAPPPPPPPSRDVGVSAAVSAALPSL
jgi:hypothetical protein